MNTTDSYSDVKKKVDYENFVCVLCLESYSVKCFGEDVNNPVTAYYLNDWNYKGDRARICSNCFYYG